MATLDKMVIKMNAGKRPDNNIEYVGHIWKIEPGQEYDMVHFTLKEINKPYPWKETVCVPANLPEEEVVKICQDVVKTITDEDIESYVQFLEYQEKFGWD